MLSLDVMNKRTYNMGNFFLIGFWPQWDTYSHRKVVLMEFLK